MLVTPGYLPPDLQPVTPAQLRLVAVPTVALAPNEVNETNADIARLSNAMQISAGKTNYFKNPNLIPSSWPKGAGPIVAASSGYTGLVNRWEIKPSAGRVTTQQSTSVTTVTGDSVKSIYSLQVTGDTSCTGTVEIKQDIPAYMAASLRASGKFAVSFHFYNGTGGNITPTLVFSTTAAQDDFTTVSQQGTASCGVCPNATWTKVSVQNIDGSGWANLQNGMRFSLVLPSGTLNAPGKSVFFHQAKLELVAATEFLPALEPDAFANENFFQNGNFDLWANTGTTATSGNAQGWFGEMVRSTEHALDGSSYTAKIAGTGAAVDYGQTILGYQTRQNLAFSCWFYNGSGSEVTPTLRADIAGGSNQLSVALAPCPTGTWTKLTAQIPAAGYAITAAGLKVYLRLTVTSSQNVYLAQMKLEPGTSPTRFRWIVENPAVTPIAGSKGLQIDTTGGVAAAALNIKADLLLLKSAGGAYLQTSLASTVLSIATGANGLDYATPMTASTWHYIYAIADSAGNAATLLSKSATAPTLPAGYIYFLLLGAIYPASTFTFPAYLQIEGRAYIHGQSVLPSTTGTSLSQVAVDISAVIPPIAKTFFGNVGVTTSGATCGFWLNPYALDGPGSVYINMAARTGSAMNGFYGSAPYMMPNLNQSFSYATSDGTANKYMEITGWTL